MSANGVNEGQSGTEGLADNLELMRFGVGGKIPVYGRLLELLQARIDGELGARLADAWQGRRFFIHYDRPLLILAAIRFDAFQTGPSHPLWNAIVAREPDLAAATGEALDAALAPDRPRAWNAIATRHVQTNETSRAVAWLWPAAIVGERAIALADIGCSAGLNLVVERLPAPWTDAASGAPIDVARAPRIAARLGIDARPLDVTDDDSATWLRAAIWPGQTARQERLDLAIDAMRAARTSASPPVIITGHAGDAPAHLARLDAELPPGGVVVAYQTVMREYIPPDERAAYQAAMKAWVAGAPGRALWIELEWGGDGATPDCPAGIFAHVGEVSLRLARCDYHPAKLWIDEAAVA